MNLKNELLTNGVVLVKNAWTKEDLSEISKDYNTLDTSLTNKEIIKDKPLIVFWKHVIGEQKRICTFDQYPSLWNFINKKIVPNVKKILDNENAYLQLLETIIFNKPYEVSNTLHWHQDVAYFPLKPNNQIAVWFPLEAVDKEAGALNYAIGSHKEGIKGSTDLHTRRPTRTTGIANINIKTLGEYTPGIGRGVDPDGDAGDAVARYSASNIMHPAPEE